MVNVLEKKGVVRVSLGIVPCVIVLLGYNALIPRLGCCMDLL